MVKLKEIVYAYKYQNDKIDGWGNTAYNNLINNYICKHI